MGNEKDLKASENTEEGRLIINEINHCKENSEDDKISAVLFGIMGAVEILIAVVGLKATLTALYLLLPSSLLPPIMILIHKLITDRKTSKLEEKLIRSR